MPEAWGRPAWAKVQHSLGLTSMWISGKGPVGPPGDPSVVNADQYVRLAGWPARCAYVERRDLYAWGCDVLILEPDLDAPGPSWRDGLRPPAWARSSRLVPTRFVLNGLAVNTAFYGSLTFPLLLLPRAARRMIRQCSGRCVGCGYTLIGLRDGRCPECGRVNPPSGVE